MSDNSPNLMIKYAVFGLVAGVIGVFISQQLGYNEGSVPVYLYGAIAGLVGGGIGGMIRQRMGKTR